MSSFHKKDSDDDAQREKKRCTPHKHIKCVICYLCQRINIKQRVTCIRAYVIVSKMCWRANCNQLVCLWTHTFNATKLQYWNCATWHNSMCSVCTRTNRYANDWKCTRANREWKRQRPMLTTSNNQSHFQQKKFALLVTKGYAEGENDGGRERARAREKKRITQIMEMTTNTPFAIRVEWKKKNLHETRLKQQIASMLNSCESHRFVYAISLSKSALFWCFFRSYSLPVHATFELFLFFCTVLVVVFLIANIFRCKIYSFAAMCTKLRHSTHFPCPHGGRHRFVFSISVSLSFSPCSSFPIHANSSTL